MTEKKMIQVSVSIRQDKYSMLKAWADERDDSVANICRGWIYTGLADLQDALGRFELTPEPNWTEETHTQQPYEPHEPGDLEQPVIR